MVVLLALLACGGSAAPEGGRAQTTLFTIDPVAMLTRASLDVRGIRPSVTDIEHINAAPDDLDSLIDDYLVDERFPDRVIDMYSEIFGTQGERFPVDFSSFSFDSEVSRTDYIRSIGEEPLRLLAAVAEADLPYTELVTADWTMHNSILGEMYPSDYPEGDSGWQRTHYTDGRPAAGILSTNGMWWRYGSTPSNLNRKRANQVSRIFLCHDYLSRPIEFNRDLNLLDEDAVADAVATNPGCVACHVSLDPLASYLYGFWYVDEESPTDATVYHPERELLFDAIGAPSPAYHGQPGGSLEDLGHQIAGDPRFVECAVEHAFSRLMGRDATAADTDALTVHREAFLSGGLTLRALFSSILSHPRYRSAMSAPAGFAEKKFVTADLLTSQVKGITGFEWTQGGVDMMKSDTIGVGNLAGRADGYRVVRNSRSPNATMLLVAARLAQGAAAHVLMREAAQPQEDRELFPFVDFSETLTAHRPAMVRQILHLHKAVLGRIIDEDHEAIAANLALWSELYAVAGDPHVSWGGVLIALLRDPDFLMY